MDCSSTPRLIGWYRPQAAQSEPVRHCCIYRYHRIQDASNTAPPPPRCPNLSPAKCDASGRAVLRPLAFSLAPRARARSPEPSLHIEGTRPPAFLTVNDCCPKVRGHRVVSSAASNTARQPRRDERGEILLILSPVERRQAAASV